MMRLVEPVLLMVTVAIFDSVTVTTPRSSNIVLSTILGAGVSPVPLTATVAAGVSGSSELIVNVAARGPALAGASVRSIVHVPIGARVPPQSFACEKSVIGAMSILAIVKSTIPRLVTVTAPVWVFESPIRTGAAKLTVFVDSMIFGNSSSVPFALTLTFSGEDGSLLAIISVSD